MEKKIFANQTLAMSLGAVGAYNVILTQYAAAMQRKKFYGKDFIRDGRLVATSSVLTGQANYPWVIAKLKNSCKNSSRSRMWIGRYNYSFL